SSYGRLRRSIMCMAVVEHAEASRRRGSRRHWPSRRRATARPSCPWSGSGSPIGWPHVDPKGEVTVLTHNVLDELLILRIPRDIGSYSGLLEVPAARLRGSLSCSILVDVSDGQGETGFFERPTLGPEFAISIGCPVWYANGH